MRSLITFGLCLGLGAGFLGLFLWLYGAARIIQALARERPGFFAGATVLYLAGQALSSYRWMLLAPSAESVR